MPIELDSLRHALTAATYTAIRRTSEPRFFETERGFQGAFYSSLRAELDRLGLITGGAILEMEYQKSAVHGLSQRPDIIFHIPTEHSISSSVAENNYAVWALKRLATIAEAQDDFEKLDQIFRELQYPIGFFINVASADNMRSHYRGAYGNRLSAVATNLMESQVNQKWSHPST
jgi:hypothetical protein